MPSDKWERVNDHSLHYQHLMTCHADTQICLTFQVVRYREWLHAIYAAVRLFSRTLKLIFNLDLRAKCEFWNVLAIHLPGQMTLYTGISCGVSLKSELLSASCKLAERANDFAHFWAQRKGFAPVCTLSDFSMRISLQTTFYTGISCRVSQLCEFLSFSASQLSG